ncbi:hypothetical protein C5167_008384 [Papaver somniferum]|uniref:Uncharacterized protein n=1 Tax=Papaver somniferum TaxID=3469 RepID=A0A4Y7JY87_PAPSO|nr:hypothetical protein C5167_008384 [Papaver somniferum]
MGFWTYNVKHLCVLTMLTIVNQMKLTIGKLEDANLNLFAVGGVISLRFLCVHLLILMVSLCCTANHGREWILVRAGLEMALTDAVTTSIGTLLLKLFGGASNTIKTDITIPIGSLDEAAKLASKYRKQGSTP